MATHVPNNRKHYAAAPPGPNPPAFDEAVVSSLTTTLAPTLEAFNERVETRVGTLESGIDTREAALWAHVEKRERDAQARITKLKKIQRPESRPFKTPRSLRLLTRLRSSTPRQRLTEANRRRVPPASQRTLTTSKRLLQPPHQQGNSSPATKAVEEILASTQAARSLRLPIPRPGVNP